MSRRPFAKLSPREEQRIVDLRAEGLTFDVIASRVGCSKGTVWNTLNASAPAIASDQAQSCTAAIGKVRAAPEAARVAAVKMHWLFGRGPDKVLDFAREVDAETDCSKCIHRQVCCENFVAGTSAARGCQACCHKYTRYDKAAVPCFSCPWVEDRVAQESTPRAKAARSAETAGLSRDPAASRTTSASTVATRHRTSPWTRAPTRERERARYRLETGLLGRWIIVHPVHDQLAWSGSCWVPHEGGLGTIAQVSNFDTREGAEVAARAGHGDVPSRVLDSSSVPVLRR